MNTKLLILLLTLFLFLFTCSSSPSGPKLKEGKWEITVRMEVKEKIPFQMPPQSFTQCITKEKAVPYHADPNQNCKITKQEIKGNTVSWIMECKTPEGPVVSEGTVTYKDTTFDGVIKMKQRGMEFTQTMKGRWIGECK